MILSRMCNLSVGFGVLTLPVRMCAYGMDVLKEKVDTVFGKPKQLKESLKQQRPGSHDASNVAWGQAAKTYKNKILILQKRALRLMFFGDYNSHAVPYFVSSSFLPLDLLYFKSVAILMHDISNSLTPTNISNLFASQSNIHSYNTRSSSRGDYYVKHSRLDKQTKSFSRYGVKIWNSLPCEMRQMSKNNFKINVHDTLLRILSEEND